MTDRPHVLFVVLDSARTDRVSAYGHERETTPNFDALADDSVRYENAFAPAPWTLPSHWSMFTGRFPSEHGVTNGFTDQGLSRPTDLDTVAETLSSRGYRTAAFSNNPWVGQLSGLDSGFDEFVEWDLEISRSTVEPTRSRDGTLSQFHWLLGKAAKQPQAILKRRFFTSNLVDRAGRWLTEVADDGTPTFTFLNLMEAHSPYYPPRSAFKRLGLTPPNPIESRLLNVRLLAYVLGKTDLSADQRERVLEFYDASLRYQDRQLGQLMATLREQGLFEETMVVICADHGKTLGEFDRDSAFPHYLRDINTNVPLLVKPPGGTDIETVTTPFELTSLAEVVTAGSPGGTELAPDTGPALVQDHIPHTGREVTDVTQWHAVVDEEYTFVRSEAGTEFLVRRGNDESVSGPDRRDQYRAVLEERVSGLSDPSEGTSTDDTQIRGGVESQLEDLGYLG